MSQISNINFKKSVELAKNPTKTALETQNEPKARQEPSQEEIAEQEANTRMFQSYKTQKESNIEIKKIEEMRRELQLKAIEQFKTNKTPENSARKRDKKR